MRFALLSLLVSTVTSFSTATSGLSSLSVTELKRLLQERGVDFRDCLEKDDLVDRLQASSRTTILPQSPYTTEEERRMDIFQRVSPAVAFITTTTKSSPRGFGTDMPLGTGSGFLWDTQGHVVTNCHVIAPQGRVMKQVKVKLAGMVSAVTAQVVGVEPEKDLAVLKMDPTSLPVPLQVATSNDLRVGQSVLAIGNPFGLDLTLTTGVISATGREVQGFGGRKIRDCVQTDAAINPGNSGGPLLDSRGRLIGVNTAIYSPDGSSVGIGFAIPVDTVRRVVNQIIRYGRVNRPSLGIHVFNDRIVQAIGAQLQQPMEGVLFTEVMPDSPIATTDLQATKLYSDGSYKLGDLIVQVNGQRVKQVEDLLAEIEVLDVGDTVNLTILRGCDPTKVKQVNVRLFSR